VAILDSDLPKAPGVLTEQPRPATQQVVELPAGTAAPNVVKAAAPAVHGHPEAGAPAPAPH